MAQPVAVDRPMQELLVPKRTRLGLLTKAKHSPVLFSQVAERLRHLAATLETEKARTEVDVVLGCPWWGLRVVAIKTIAAWGGAANKAWLIQRACRPAPSGTQSSKKDGWWSVETRAAMDAVAPALDDTDAGWVLTLLHENLSAMYRFYAYEQRVPDDLFLAWLQTPPRQDHHLLRVRLISMVGRRRPLPGYMALMQTFASDKCGMVAEKARKWIAAQSSKG